MPGLDFARKMPYPFFRVCGEWKLTSFSEASGTKDRVFPVQVRPLGDRVLHGYASRMPRPWEARRGDVFCVEMPLARIRRLDEIGVWRSAGPGVARSSYGLTDLPVSVLDRVAPTALMLAQSEDIERVVMRAIGERQSRFGLVPPPDPDCLVCLSFWGGMVVIDECGFGRDPVGDAMIPAADFGFGIIWAEAGRAKVPDALLDVDIVLGTYICERLYPAMPDPVPTSRALGLAPRYLVD